MVPHFSHNMCMSVHLFLSLWFPTFLKFFILLRSRMLSSSVDPKLFILDLDAYLSIQLISDPDWQTFPVGKYCAILCRVDNFLCNNFGAGPKSGSDWQKMSDPPPSGSSTWFFFFSLYSTVKWPAARISEPVAVPPDCLQANRDGVFFVTSAVFCLVFSLRKIKLLISSPVFFILFSFKLCVISPGTH